jgi:hypothetical protein
MEVSGQLYSPFYTRGRLYGPGSQSESCGEGKKTPVPDGNLNSGVQTAQSLHSLSYSGCYSNNPRSWIFLEKRVRAGLVKKLRTFYGTWSRITSLWEIIISPHPEPDESHPHILFLQDQFSIILPSTPISSKCSPLVPKPEYEALTAVFYSTEDFTPCCRALIKNAYTQTVDPHPNNDVTSYQRCAHLYEDLYCKCMAILDPVYNEVTGLYGILAYRRAVRQTYQPQAITQIQLELD